MALTLLRVSASSRRPDKLVLIYSEPVRQSDPTGMSDALNLNNYQVLDLNGNDVPISSVVTINPRIVMFTIPTQQAGFTYELIVNNVTAINGDVILGELQTLYGVGADSTFSAGIGSGANVFTSFLDTVSRGDNALSPGVADSGQAWVPQAGSTWGVLSNGIKEITGTGNVVCLVETSIADGTWTMRQKTTQMFDNWMWVIRGVDETNFIGIYQFLGTLSIWKNVASVFTKMTGDFASVNGAGIVYEAITSGNNIDLYRSGILVTSLVLATHATGTKTGIWAGNSGTDTATWDAWGVDP